MNSFGPFYFEGVACPAITNNEAIFEDLIEDLNTDVLGKTVLLPEDVYADPLLVSPSMSRAFARRHGD